ncbi:MAG: hypothetical protein ABSF69_23335 [Polyangiaceae bacterium]|jgi:hypothetical protein
MSVRSKVAANAWAVIFLAGCSPGSQSSAAGTVGGGSDVLQHHTHASRDGVTPDASMSKAVASALKLDPTYAPAITGNVYAQPLYVASGTKGKPTLIIATESNHVVALDPTTSAAPFWDQTYGTPVSGVSTALGCGNIDPLGITGTPVVDPTSHAIYFDAMTLANGAPAHLIHAVSIDTGLDLPGWPVAVDGVTGFTSKTQNQRGALQLLNGVVYVPYGGHDGDCNTYYGWVVAVPVAAPSTLSGWSVGSMQAGASRGGIWGVGGVASDGTSLFVSTGNTTNAGTTWSGGEAVLRLTPPTPSLTADSAHAFYPTAWMNYDANDVDLGGANPILFDMPTAPIPHLAVALGKDGILYLLNRDDLGGEGNALSTTSVASDTGPASAGALNGAGAAYTTAKGTYIAFHANSHAPGLVIAGCPSGQTGGNVGVAQVSATQPPKATVVWCTRETGLGSPMVTNNGNGDIIVWDANQSLYGYDGDTGTKVFDGSSAPLPSAMHYFNTPIDAAGNLVVATSAPGGVSIFRP